MDNYLDYKATIWFRIPIWSEEALFKVKQKLKEGLTPADLYDLLDSDIEIGQCEPLYDTEEFLKPIENGNQPTIEIYKGDGSDVEMIWDNTVQSE
jgi:hypothetical protein